MIDNSFLFSGLFYCLFKIIVLFIFYILIFIYINYVQTEVMLPILA